MVKGTRYRWIVQNKIKGRNIAGIWEQCLHNIWHGSILTEIFLVITAGSHLTFFSTIPLSRLIDSRQRCSSQLSNAVTILQIQEGKKTGQPIFLSDLRITIRKLLERTSFKNGRGNMNYLCWGVWNDSHLRRMYWTELYGKLFLSYTQKIKFSKAEMWLPRYLLSKSPMHFRLLRGIKTKGKVTKTENK